jgi:hypothetical protein
MPMAPRDAGKKGGKGYGPMRDPNMPPPRTGVEFTFSRETFAYHPDFNVVEAIVGPNNRHILHILQEVNHEVDIEAHGFPSAHPAVPNEQRFRLLVLSESSAAVETARSIIEDLLSTLGNKFQKWWAANQGPDKPMDAAIAFECSRPEPEEVLRSHIQHPNADHGSGKRGKKGRGKGKAGHAPY